MTYNPGDNPQLKVLQQTLEQVHTLLKCPKLERGSLMVSAKDQDGRHTNQLIVWGSYHTQIPKQLLRHFLEGYAAELEATMFLLKQGGEKPATKREQDLKRISDNLRFLGPRMIMEQIYKSKPGKFEHFRNYADMKDLEYTREQLIEIAYDENIKLTY